MMITRFNHIFLFSLVFILLGVVLIDKTPCQTNLEHTGSIYGGVIGVPLRKVDHQITPVSADVHLAGTRLHAKADMNGIFYISNVPTGKHTLIVSLKGYDDIFLDSVLVLPDSTTIVSDEFYFGLVHRTQWNAEIGVWVEGTDTSVTGQIVGHLDFFGVPKVDMKVFAEGTFWEAKVDSSGDFEIDRILAGKYVVFARGDSGYMGDMVFRDVEVKNDSASVVDFRVQKFPPRPFQMLPHEGTNEPLVWQWQKKFTKIKHH